MLVEGTQSLNRVAPTVGSSEGTPSVSSATSPNVLDRPEDRSSGRQATALANSSSDSLELAAGTQALSRNNNPEDTSGTAASGQIPEDRAKVEEEDRERENERLETLAGKVNEKLDNSLSLRFSQDEKTGSDIIQLIEQESGDVVRQFPPEEALEFLERFEESVSGLFVSKQA